MASEHATYRNGEFIRWAPCSCCHEDFDVVYLDEHGTKTYFCAECFWHMMDQLNEPRWPTDCRFREDFYAFLYDTRHAVVVDILPYCINIGQCTRLHEKYKEKAETDKKYRNLQHPKIPQCCDHRGRFLFHNQALARKDRAPGTDKFWLECQHCQFINRESVQKSKEVVEDILSSLF